MRSSSFEDELGGCSSGKQMEQPPNGVHDTFAVLSSGFLANVMYVLLSTPDRRRRCGACTFGFHSSGRMGIATASIADGTNADR
jgi:hypothetical protein